MRIQYTSSYVVPSVREVSFRGQDRVYLEKQNLMPFFQWGQLARNIASLFDIWPDYLKIPNQENCELSKSVALKEINTLQAPEAPFWASVINLQKRMKLDALLVYAMLQRLRNEGLIETDKYFRFQKVRLSDKGYNQLAPDKNTMIKKDGYCVVSTWEYK